MITAGIKKQGTPNWADCATTDLDAAEAFYAVTFGWQSERTTDADGSVYSLQRLDGAKVAAIYELSEEIRAMGVPPHWGTYVEVDDLPAALERVTAEGGVVVEGPIDHPGYGTFAFIQDPVGAYLRLWHSDEAHGGEVFNVPGSMMWNELMTKAPTKAATFYENVLGVTAETMTEPVPYTTLNVDGRGVAGILECPQELGEQPASWDVYFASDDVDATVQRAISAGGSVLREPFDIPNVGRIAVIQDPMGAVFEVMHTVVSED